MPDEDAAPIEAVRRYGLDRSSAPASTSGFKDQSHGHHRRPTTSASTTNDSSATGDGQRRRSPTTSLQFLQLLTTQLKNQNPLDPLDTNQFTQQLVQFAQVEQQLKSNDQLATLVALQKTTQSSAGAGFRRQDRGGRRQYGAAH